MIFVILSFLTLFSCTSTRKPYKQITINNLSKVLVVALFKNETNTHTAEDQMVGYLNGKGNSSYLSISMNIITFH